MQGQFIKFKGGCLLLEEKGIQKHRYLLVSLPSLLAKLCLDNGRSLVSKPGIEESGSALPGSAR